VTTIYIGETAPAADGDYILRPAGDGFAVGLVEDGEVWWLDPEEAR
jgi:hypothetical protein